MRKPLLVLACTAAVVALVAPGSYGATPGPSFAAPVLLTTDKYTGGYEPSVTVDRFNNIYASAHKQNHNLVLSPDSRATVPVRSQSWLWTSKDGKTFTDMPGLTPLQEQNAEFGDEGDIAADDAGRVYFVDTNVTDNSFSRYRATGNGQLVLETTRPIGPFGEPVDDRPWIAAHGDGVVMYVGNSGNRTYRGGSGDGDAYGPGRYTVYMSYDRGDTFDPLGVTLNDSGWCRPAADHRKGSKRLYVLCTNDGGKLWAYVSNNDGKTWSRHRMGTYSTKDTIATYPWVSVGADGTVYALYNDSVTRSGGPVESHLRLLSSKNGGRTWNEREVTPQPGMIRYSSIDVAPNGTVGIGYYFRPTTKSAWYVYAATAKPGQPFRSGKVSATPIASADNSSPFGDFFQVAYGPDNKLNVVYTSMNDDLLFEGLNSDIYYAREK